MSSGILPLQSYHRAQSLGAGSYGSVIAVYDDDGNEFALKLFDNDDDSDDDGDEAGIALGALREISVLRLLRGQNAHPNIVEMHDIQTGYEDTEVGAGTGGCLSMAMPLFPLGSLADYMPKICNKREKVAIAHGILCAVAHLHDNSIIHRDIKSDNIVLKYADENSTLLRPVLIDFSLAKVLELDLLISGDGSKYKVECDGQTHTPTVGTPTYRAPEVVEQMEYGLPSDLWSVGVVLLELLQGKCLDVVKDKTAATYIDQSLESLPEDQPFPNLIRGLLQKDPEQRLTAREALDSEVFRKFGFQPDESTGRIIKINEAVPFEGDDEKPSSDKENSTNGNAKKSGKSKADPKLVKRFQKIQKICRTMEWTNPVTAQAALTYSIQMEELCDIDDPNEIQALLDCVVLAHKFFEFELCDLTELEIIGGKAFEDWDINTYYDNESTLFIMMDFCLFPRKFFQL